jgi:phospholipid/cholesterol/gamma-HCH transport system substrate-binding protein
MNALRYIKVALFFIVLGGAGIVYIVMSAEGFTGFNTKTYETVLQDATGLSTRSKVYMAGVPVGKIRAIHLEENTARIRLILLSNVELRQNAVISRKASSILGTSILSIDPGSEPNPLLPPGGMIQPDVGMDMNAIMSTVSDLGSNLGGILEEFQQNQLALLAISLETFNSIAAKIEARTDEDLELISRILESTALITERTEWILAARDEDINVSLLEIRLAMQNMRQISDEIAQGRGNLGQAVYDDRLYNSLISTVEQTEEAVVKLQGVLDGAGEFLNRANSLGIMVDSQASYGFNSSHVRAGASIRLEPASGDRWYRIGVRGAPDGVNSRIVTTTTDISGTVTSYEDKTETKYSFSVDAELARRYKYITIRGGLLESTAGIGLDIHPLRWAALSGELFNFRSGASPNLRGTLTVYPFFNPDSDNPLNWIYLYGGVSDALSPGRDFFLGGGLRFSDREIKGLVGLAVTAAGAQ